MPLPSPSTASAVRPRADKTFSRHAVFSRAGQLFGLPIEFVREVLSGQPLTRVPRAHNEILGVLSLRGEILPVVVIDRWLGLPAGEDDATRPILVLRRGELLVGLRVDAIRSVASVSLDEVQPHPASGDGTCLAGIWHPKGQPPITLVAGPALLDSLCQYTSDNF